jgi:hypothetical protein
VSQGLSKMPSGLPISRKSPARSSETSEPNARIKLRGPVGREFCYPRSPPHLALIADRLAWRTNEWARILAYVTGTVDQELLARNEYLFTENSILRAQSKGRLRLSDVGRATLGEIRHRLGRKVLGEVANVARPNTILAWYRKLVARKFDCSKARRGPADLGR